MRSFAKLKFECYNKNANLLQYNLIQTEWIKKKSYHGFSKRLKIQYLKMLPDWKYLQEVPRSIKCYSGNLRLFKYLNNNIQWSNCAGKTMQSFVFFWFCI